MNKDLEELRDLVEYITRIDYVTPEVRGEVKGLLIKAYKDAEGLFAKLDKALERTEPKKAKMMERMENFYGTLQKCRRPICPKCGTSVECDNGYCPKCGQRLNWEEVQ